MGYGELDCGRSCDYKVGSPSYLDKIAWREGKPQHYSEPKLILDLSHWKRNTHHNLTVPTQLVGGSVEDRKEVEKELKEDKEDQEETGDLFQEISRWVQSTKSRLHSPSQSTAPLSSSCCTSSPPLPLSPIDLSTTVFHYTDIVQQQSADCDLSRLETHLPITSSNPSLPFSLHPLLPSTPTSLPPPQPVENMLPPSPIFPLPALQPPSSTASISVLVNDDSSESLPVKQKDRLFDLDMFISRALKLCNKEKADVKKGKEKQPNANRKVPRLPEFRTSPSHTPKT